MKYYFKQSVFPFIYLIFMALIAFGIQTISGLLWLKIILAILNLSLYAVVVCSVFYKEGQEAVKVQMANDLERREIIRTGEDRPLKLREEYKTFKGFLFGLFACLPLILLLIAHTIVHLAGGTYTGLGAIACLIYNMFFIFFNFGVNASGEATVLSWSAYYVTLVAIPALMLMTGIAYILGAKKIMRQQEMIKEKQRQIYGE